MNNDPLSPLKGWRQIAAFVGVSTRTLQRWHSDLPRVAHIPVKKIGGSVFISKKQLESWMDRYKRGVYKYLKANKS